VITYSPQLEEAFHRRQRPVWVSWRMDETYIRVKGEWRYLYRVVDRSGEPVDFLLTEHRDTEAARRFLKKAIRRHGVPETITIDGSDASETAIKSYKEEHGTKIIIRRVKYLNNIVEQDHRAVKRVTRPMLGFIELHQSRFTFNPACLKKPRMRSGRRRRRAKPRFTPARRSLTLVGTALRRCCLTLPWHPSSGFRLGA
jgi:putative transposase